ncbi:hypothetical protein ACVRY7_05370 [Streptococcus ictaluri]|uniref:Uncharacterized protein n=1 Tax=Streptococcus ictaluri 707-05 TaxID=764299 RepID=G5K1V2_9STRE|nr:hypothetical protein [Streptococcus ictaluri]EHI70120.1 hypothetical protein STRIC_2360 [Streptococcus ictaluri 707-05]
MLSFYLVYLGSRFNPYPFFSFYAGLIGFVLWGVAFQTIKTYPNLNQLARNVLRHETMKERTANVEDINITAVRVDDKEIALAKELPLTYQSLKGIAYLNAIFFYRMGKQLRKHIRRRLAIIALITVILWFIWHWDGQVDKVNHSYYVPVLYACLISGYLFYVGEPFIKFTFYHLDRPLLKYKEYRERQLILESLKKRFWSLIKYNLPIFLVLTFFSCSLYYNLFEWVWYEVLILVLVQLVSLAFFTLYFLYLYYLL